MIKLFPLLLLAFYSSASAADIISVNFQVVDPSDGWAYDMETITEDETYGFESYPGSATTVSNWNNLKGVSGGASVAGVSKASGLVNSNGVSTDVNVAFDKIYHTWNGEYNNSPSKTGVIAWNMSTISEAVTLSNLNSFAATYDLIIYLGWMEDSGFVSGSISIDGNVANFKKGNEQLLFQGFTNDSLTISLKNMSPPGSDKAGVVIGGFQLVAK